MRLILFIGHHKVGSSALQAYLAQNALAYLRQGILYPAVETEGMANLLALAMGKSDFPTQPLSPNQREAHNGLGFALMAEDGRRAVPDWHDGLPPVADMLRAIQRQIEVFKPHTVILAAEVFANFAWLSPESISRLLAPFEGMDIHLTATLRRVDEYMISWHGQRMLFGHKAARLSGKALTNYYGGINFDYRLMLEGWLDALSGAAVRLRPYDQVLANGGAVQDFLKGYGLAPIRRQPMDGTINKGIHRGLIEIARRANRTLDPESARFLFRTLLALGDKMPLPPAREVEMFGAANRVNMMARFEPIHDWLSQVSGIQPFFSDMAAIGRALPHPEAEVNRMALDDLRRNWLGEFDTDARAFLEAVKLGDPEE